MAKNLKSTILPFSPTTELSYEPMYKIPDVSKESTSLEIVSELQIDAWPHTVTHQINLAVF